MSENKYKIRITTKSLPFSGDDMVICKNMSLVEAVNFSNSLNKNSETDKIALVEYEATENETDEQSKHKVISDVKKHGLDDFAIFKNNMLILTHESMTEISKMAPPTDFKANTVNYGADAENAITNALKESASVEKKVEIVTKSNEFDNLNFVTYDIVHESVPFPIASGLYLAQSAVTIAEAIRDGEAINSSKIMQALDENNVYSNEVTNHVEKLRALLKQNKQKTKSELAEEAAINSLADIEALFTRMNQLDQKKRLW